MLNQFVIVGRLVYNPELHETENGKSNYHYIGSCQEVIKMQMENMKQIL